MLIDPITQEWLATNTDPVFGFPSVVRFSWSTAANILSSDASLSVKWFVHASQPFIRRIKGWLHRLAKSSLLSVGRMMMEIALAVLRLHNFSLQRRVPQLNTVNINIFANVV